MDDFKQQYSQMRSRQRMAYQVPISDEVKRINVQKEQDIEHHQIERLIDVVIEETGIDVRSHRRKKPIVAARKVIALYLFKNYKLTYSAIGTLLGDFDHSSAISMINTAQDLSSVKDQYYTEIERTILNIINKCKN